jgi:hypothetical protein
MVAVPLLQFRPRPISPGHDTAAQSDSAPARHDEVRLTRAGRVVVGEFFPNRDVSARDQSVRGRTLTDALARRDVLRLRHGVISSAADAAAGEGQRGFRQLRSELNPALPVADLRRQADDLARQLREVDTLIQRTNWEADLLD